MRLDKSQWAVENVSPLELTLDQKNARIYLDENASQTAIRNRLIEKEDVLGLAARIAAYGGLFPAESIIAFPENGNLVVVEGNRRVCACQILLKNNLIADDDLMRQIPVIDSNTQKNIEIVRVEIATTRDISDPVVANFHAASLRRPWSSLAIMKYVHRKLQEGSTVFDVAEHLNFDPKQIRKLSTCFRICHFANTLSEWTAMERELLWSHDLDYEPFLYVVLSPITEQHFGEPLFFDNGEPNFPFHNELFQIIKKIALHSLFAQKKQQDHRVTKSSNVQQYLLAAFPEYKRASPQISFLDDDIAQAESATAVHAPESAKKRGTSAESRAEKLQGESRFRHDPVKFFEKLQCKRIEDERLMQLCKETRRISRDLNKLPLAASMLLRSLIEWSLTYHLKKIGKWEELNGVKKRRHGPTLDDIMRFCSNKSNNVFANDKFRRRISMALQEKTIDELNWNTHSDDGNYSVLLLSKIAGDFRSIILYINVTVEYD